MINKKQQKINLYDKVWDKKCVSYSIIDDNGKTISIKSKNQKKHSSSHRLDQSPTIHFNKGWIIQNPDDVEVNPKSNHPQAIKNMSKGNVVKYSKNDFIHMLKIPGWEMKGDVVSVFVLYDEKINKNYTLTHIIEEKV